MTVNFVGLFYINIKVDIVKRKKKYASSYIFINKIK